MKKGQKLSDKLSNSKEKDASTKKPETKNCTSPGKSKVNKLKQKISKLNKPEDKEAALEKKKSPLKRKQYDGKSSNACTELSIKQLVLKNKDDCKDVKKNGKCDDTFPNDYMANTNPE